MFVYFIINYTEPIKNIIIHNTYYYTYLYCIFGNNIIKVESLAF